MPNVRPAQGREDAASRRMGTHRRGISPPNCTLLPFAIHRAWLSTVAIRVCPRMRSVMREDVRARQRSELSSLPRTLSRTNTDGPGRSMERMFLRHSSAPLRPPGAETIGAGRPV